jgi:hypothetical protein
LVHEGGYRIVKDYQDRWCFKRPDGIAVPECGYSSDHSKDDQIHNSSVLVKNPSAEGFAVGVT